MLKKELFMDWLWTVGTSRLTEPLIGGNPEEQQYLDCVSPVDEVDEICDVICRTMMGSMGQVDKKEMTFNLEMVLERYKTVEDDTEWIKYPIIKLRLVEVQRGSAAQ